MAAIWKRLKRGKPKCLAHGKTEFSVDAFGRIVLKVGDFEVILGEGDLMKLIQQKIKSLEKR